VYQPTPRRTAAIGETPMLLQHLIQQRLHRIGPDLISIGVRMQRIGYDLLGQHAIGAIDWLFHRSVLSVATKGIYAHTS
jgi:hypothetical protein